MLGSGSWIFVLLGISPLRPDQSTLAYLLAALSGAGIAAAYVIPWAMVPDIVEYDQARTGQRREGSYYAFASFFQKLATGFAIWAMGLALSAAGYLTPSGGNPYPIQPAEAVTAIRWFAGPVPALLLAMAIVCAWFYPITRESHQALLQELASKEA